MMIQDTTPWCLGLICMTSFVMYCMHEMHIATMFIVGSENACASGPVQCLHINVGKVLSFNDMISWLSFFHFLVLCVI